MATCLALVMKRTVSYSQTRIWYVILATKRCSLVVMVDKPFLWQSILSLLCYSNNFGLNNFVLSLKVLLSILSDIMIPTGIDLGIDHAI